MVKVPYSPPPSPRPKKRLRYATGPFVGMRDSLDPSASRLELARLLENCYPLDPQFGGSVVGRPGFTLTTGQGGSAGARTGQLVYQFTKLDGTENTVRIVGGKFYTYNWGTDVWTETLTSTHFAAATNGAITLSTTARCYAVTFANQMIVNDGVNRPWAWDGTAGGGLTLLNNAPAVCFGPPTVYYAKLFFIKNASRSTFAWSEENKPNVGYEAGGYNNAWQLGQTDQESLFCLLGTNEALYVWRARSTTAIAGAVTPDFSTSGTREGVSETEGTAAPASVFYHNRRIFFINADGRPQLLTPGGGVTPIWSDYRETINGLDPAQFDDCEGLYIPVLELAAFGVAETGASRRNKLMTFQIGPVPQASGVFSNFDFDRIGVTKNASGEPTVMHLDSGGYAYYHGDPFSGPWNDGLQAATEPVPHVVESSYVGQRSSDEKNWDRIDLALRLSTDITNCSVEYDTPRGSSVAQTFTVEGAFARWDIALWDVDSWSGALDQHKAIGTAGNGRWFLFRLRHEALAEEFGLARAEVSASVVGPFPLTL